jgi:hypothetical protein
LSRTSIIRLSCSTRWTAVASTLATACIRLTSESENDRRVVESASRTPNGRSVAWITTPAPLMAPCTTATAEAAKR